MSDVVKGVWSGYDIVSNEAIAAAVDFRLPSNDMLIRRSYYRNEWTILFDWYNKFVNTSLALSVHCVPCYKKVYAAIKAAKNEDNNQV